MVVGAVEEDVERFAAHADALRVEIAGFDLDAPSASGAARLAESLGRLERAVAFARIRAVAHALSLGAHRLAGVANPTDWAAGLAGSSAAQARRDARLAGRPLPSPVAAALTDGDISLDQAREIAAVAADNPDAVDGLVAASVGASLDTTRDLTRQVRTASISPDELHDRQRRLRRVRTWIDRNGMPCIHARLTPEIGTVLVARLEAEAARIHRHARKNGSPELFGAHMADALAAVTGLDPAHPRSARSANVELSIVIDLRALQRGEAEPGEVCHIVGGGPIPVEVARHHAAGAFIQGVLHDGTDVLKIKRFGRRYPAELLAALNLGDPPTFDGPRCVDCGSRFRLEKDHVDPIANNGPTTKTNTQWRCRPCHVAKTEHDRNQGLLGPRAPTAAQLAARAAANRRRATQRAQATTTDRPAADHAATADPAAARAAILTATLAATTTPDAHPNPQQPPNPPHPGDTPRTDRNTPCRPGSSNPPGREPPAHRTLTTQ